jgi:hypothetical protein
MLELPVKSPCLFVSRPDATKGVPDANTNPAPVELFIRYRAFPLPELGASIPPVYSFDVQSRWTTSADLFIRSPSPIAPARAEPVQLFYVASLAIRLEYSLSTGRPYRRP